MPFASAPRPSNITSTIRFSRRSRAPTTALPTHTGARTYSGMKLFAKFKNPRAKHGFQGRTCSIISVGSYVPERILTNADLEKTVDTSDEWITSRTGIKERHIAADGEFTSDMAANAARRAMESGGITADQIDLI